MTKEERLLTRKKIKLLIKNADELRRKQSMANDTIAEWIRRHRLELLEEIKQLQDQLK